MWVVPVVLVFIFFNFCSSFHLKISDSKRAKHLQSFNQKLSQISRLGIFFKEHFQTFSNWVAVQNDGRALWASIFFWGKAVRTRTAPKSGKVRIGRFYFFRVKLWTSTRQDQSDPPSWKGPFEPVWRSGVFWVLKIARPLGEIRYLGHLASTNFTDCTIRNLP